MFQKKANPNVGSLKNCKLEGGKLDIEANVFGKLKIEIDKKKDTYLIETAQIKIIYEKGTYSIDAKTEENPEEATGETKK